MQVLAIIMRNVKVLTKDKSAGIYILKYLVIKFVLCCCSLKKWKDLIRYNSNKFYCLVTLVKMNYYFVSDKFWLKSNVFGRNVFSMIDIL